MVLSVIVSGIKTDSVPFSSVTAIFDKSRVPFDLFVKAVPVTVAMVLVPVKRLVVFTLLIYGTTGPSAAEADMNVAAELV